MISVRALSQNQWLFGGRGIDWGCGTGCLAIVAAKIPRVRSVIGLDLSRADVAAARENAALNGVGQKTTFLHSDSYGAMTLRGQEDLQRVKGNVDFVVSNPSGSEGDDGFSLRRAVLAGCCEFLRDGGVVGLQVSIQYGQMRIDRALRGLTGLTYQRVIATTPWVPFDLRREDLRRLLDSYVTVERQRGLAYSFGDPRNDGQTNMTACSALDLFESAGTSPLTKWQMHLFSFCK
jgi:SAM-dependent methyltransferase